MPKPESRRCEAVRDLLLDRAGGGTVDPLTEDLVTHLAACSSCRVFAEGLDATRGLFVPVSLHTRWVRERVLCAVAAPGAPPTLPAWLLLPPLVGLGVVLSFVAPLWVSSKMLSSVLSSQVLSLAAGLAVVCSQAILLAACGLVPILLRDRFGASDAAPLQEV